MPALHLHLGAHKTGSTFLQKSFLANLESLDSAGVAYAPLAEVRTEVTPAILRRHAWRTGGGDARSQCREFLASALKDRRLLLLSDENLLGSPYRFSKRKVMYPKASRNIKALADLVGGNTDITIYLAVRDYASWLESAYLQLLKRKQLIPFADFVRPIRLESLSWLALLRRLSAAVPRADLVVWRYESFLEDNLFLASRLSQSLGIPGLKLVSSRGNPSFSAIAHEVLMTCRSRGIQDRHLPGLMKYLRKNLTVADGYPRAAFLRQQVAQSLSARYRLHLQQVARLPKVVVLDPRTR